MGIPNWGHEVIATQVEHTQRLDSLEVKVDRLEGKVDKLEAWSGDLMIFLQEQFSRMERRFDEKFARMERITDAKFASVERLIGVAAEGTQSDQRAYAEQQRANSETLATHGVRLDDVEESQQVTTITIHSLVRRVGSLEGAR